MLTPLAAATWRQPMARPLSISAAANSAPLSWAADLSAQARSLTLPRPAWPSWPQKEETPDRVEPAAPPTRPPAKARGTKVKEEDAASGLLKLVFLSTLALRATGPAALISVVAHAVGLVVIPRVVHAWLAVEAGFYLLSQWMARAMSVHQEPPPLSSRRRQQLWRRILADPARGGSVAEFVGSWFYRDRGPPPIALARELAPQPLRRLLPQPARRPSAVTYEELSRNDVETWLSHGLFGRPWADIRFDVDRRLELGTLVGEMERAAGRRLRETPEARSGTALAARPMLPNLDPVRWTARPLAYYAVTHGGGALLYAPRTMSAAGFGRREKVKSADGRKTLRYYVRAAAPGKEAAPPIVFVHGIGVGPPPYAQFLARLGEATGRMVVAVEMPSIAQRLSGPPPEPRRFAALVSTLLAKHGFTEAHLLGHSMGSAFVSYVARHAPQATASLTLLDPICLSMHNAAVTKAVVYPRSDAIQEEIYNFFFKDELFTSRVVARHLWWYEAGQWLDDQAPERPTLVALSTEDAIVPSKAVASAWGSEGAQARGVRLHTMPGMEHGEWLFTEAALRGLINATTNFAAAADEAAAARRIDELAAASPAQASPYPWPLTLD